MDSSLSSSSVPSAGRVIPYLVAVVIGGVGIGYAVYEHHGAESLAVQNQQMTSQLSTTHSQLDALTAKVNALAIDNQNQNQAKPAPAPVPQHSSAVVAGHPAVGGARHRNSAQEARFQKLESQLDAQNKAIEDTRNDLVGTRTELTGSIARTHDELVVLEKKGERNYFEFDLAKSKEFKREGPLSLSLRKANTKRQYADLQLIVDDRTVTQKHVNLLQPVMFYQPESQLPMEVVINDISKDHIHGYISAPKYRPSELTASATPAPGQGTDAAAQAQPPARQRLPLPSNNQP
jgi:hypothetical protein